MIVVVLQNPDPANPKRKNSNVEVRIRIDGITMEEADTLGDAIAQFAAKMGRKHVMDAFQAESELVN
jgi:hypothetical protein